MIVLSVLLPKIITLFFGSYIVIFLALDGYLKYKSFLNIKFGAKFHLRWNSLTLYFNMLLLKYIT